MHCSPRPALVKKDLPYFSVRYLSIDMAERVKAEAETVE